MVVSVASHTCLGNSTQTLDQGNVIEIQASGLCWPLGAPGGASRSSRLPSLVILSWSQEMIRECPYSGFLLRSQGRREAHHRASDPEGNQASHRPS